jgi:hypothetical protein
VIALSDLVASLLDAVPLEAGDEGAAIRIEVEEVELALPIEARMARDGSFVAGAPRGRIATGFDAPLGALALVVARVERGEQVEHVEHVEPGGEP